MSFDEMDVDTIWYTGNPSYILIRSIPVPLSRMKDMHSLFYRRFVSTKIEFPTQVTDVYSPNLKILRRYSSTMSS